MRLIDADALKQQFEIWDEDDEVAVWSIMNEVNSAPTIEPDRKKGQWIEIPDEVFASTYQCSECGAEPLIDGSEYALSNYCPNCGADMRERRTDG